MAQPPLKSSILNIQIKISHFSKRPHNNSLGHESYDKNEGILRTLSSFLVVVTGAKESY